MHCSNTKHNVQQACYSQRLACRYGELQHTPATESAPAKTTLQALYNSTPLRAMRVPGKDAIPLLASLTHVA